MSGPGHLDEQAMRELALEACRAARRFGADFADVAIGWGRHISVAVDANDIRACEQHEPCGLSVRAFVNGGTGTCGGDGIPTPEQIARHAETAVRLARLAGRDELFVDLPSPADPLIDEAALHLYDPAVAALTLADAVALARDNIERAMAADSACLVNGDVHFASGSGVLASTTGVAVASRSTFAELSLFAIARDGDDVGSFSDFTMGRHWSDLRIEPLAAAVVAGARQYQHARPCRPRTLPLVLGPLAAHALVAALAGAASAESIRRKRSLLADRLGRPVAAPLVTLEDRPLEPRGIHSRSFDGEGSPCRPVVIIDRGVFAEALTNHYNARLAGLPNNGRGTRRASVSPTNLQLRPGQRTLAELIGEVDDGVYLHAGSLDPDAASGDISTVLDFALKIDRGRLTYPLAGTMVAGNLNDLLTRIDAISSDYRAEPGSVMPAVRIDAVQFSGGA